MIDHPSVVAEAAREHPSPRAVLRREEGLKIVTYGCTRVNVDRRAWEMLPPDGVLVIRVRPSTGPSFALAFTEDELTTVFGEVRTTKSWDSVRCYHFPKPPPAISSFRVATRVGMSQDGDLGQVTTISDEPGTPREVSTKSVGSGVTTRRGPAVRTASVPRGRPHDSYALDGVDQLTAILVRAEYPSVVAAVAEHTVFLHPDTVMQTNGAALFPIVRSMARRGQIGLQSDGRRVLFDDNLSPTNAFLWAGRILRGRDVQFNHIWSDSSNPDAYTALWNLCATAAFLAKTTDGSNHPDVTAALRFRAYSLYGALPAGEPTPVKPDGYDDLVWAPHPEPVINLERVLRDRLRASPKSRTTVACRKIGWYYSGWAPDGDL